MANEPSMRDESSPELAYGAAWFQQEMARLHAELDAWRDIGRRVAAKGATDAHGVTGLVRCYECGIVGHAPLQHSDGCLAEQARALLAPPEATHGQ